MNAKDSKYPICRHIKTNGRRCQSPALDGGALCYFHLSLRRSHPRAPDPAKEVAKWSAAHLKIYEADGNDPMTLARAFPQQNEIHFPPLEDAESIQLAISMLFNAIATGQIHVTRCRTLLYALQLASFNVRALAPARRQDEDFTTLATRIDDDHPGQALASPIDGNGIPVAPAPPESATGNAPPTLDPIDWSPLTDPPVAPRTH